MRRVLVVTWALGTASGVLLGLFGVHLVSSRFSNTRTLPLSHPEVLSALRAARAASLAPEEIALPETEAPAPDTAVPPPSPPVDAAPTRPSAGATSSPAPTPPASSLPRPGATAGAPADTAVAAAVPSTTATAPAPPPPSSTSTTAKATTTTRPKPDSRKGRGPTTTTEKPTPPSRPKPSEKSDGIKSIETPGGDVWVKFSDGKVRYQMARPDNGYTVHVWDYGTERVIVEFVSGDKHYFVRAYYKDGRPEWDVAKCTGKSYRNLTCR